MMNKNMISDWLKEHGDPEVENFVAKNLAIAEKVRIALQDRGWSKAQLADVMGKKPSEVSKWLSGMHNLTLKSIIKMEIALEIDLIHTELVKEYEYVYLGKLENSDRIKTQADEYSGDSELIEYSTVVGY